MRFMGHARRLGAIGAVMAAGALGGVVSAFGALGAFGAFGPTASARAAGSASAPCAWAGESDQRDVNIGAPDTDAYYVSAFVPVSAKLRIDLHGDFPFARYFSFHVYNLKTLQPVATIYDQEIRADAGSSNPYRHRVKPGSGDTYEAHIVFTREPAHPARNTMYVDPSGMSNEAMLIYRIYVPTDPSDPSGGVNYPSLDIDSATGATTYDSEPDCATIAPPGGSKLYEELADLDYPSYLPSQTVPGATKDPTWTRSFGSQLGNEQNAYLGAIISRKYGQILVIHGKAPTFPNNRKGQPVYGHHQVRYWSFCTYDTQGQEGFGCVADYAADVRHGTFTYVVSDPGVRPKNATAAKGVAWLPWGGDQYGAQVVERNILPEKRFRHAIEDITQTGRDSSAKHVMGPYFPQAAYCSTATFERGGWRACFAAAGLPH